MADARILSVRAGELGAMCPREWWALQEARIRDLRQQWTPFSNAAAAYFEAHRQTGSAITPDHFLLGVASRESVSEEQQRVIDIYARQEFDAEKLARWIKPARPRKAVKRGK